MLARYKHSSLFCQCQMLRFFKLDKPKRFPGCPINNLDLYEQIILSKIVHLFKLVKVIDKGKHIISLLHNFSIVHRL
jgi:hypothetical protein